VASRTIGGLFSRCRSVLADDFALSRNADLTIQMHAPPQKLRGTLHPEKWEGVGHEDGFSEATNVI
jgi:hypothetical protein